MRRTLVVAVATFSLMVGGTGAVIAGGDSKSKGNDDNNGNDDQGKNAGKKQYSHCKKSNPQPDCVPKTCKKSQNPQTDNCTPKPPKTCKKSQDPQTDNCSPKHSNKGGSGGSGGSH